MGLLLLGDEAKKALIGGINTIADAVKTSMGAEGKTAVIRSRYGFSPEVTKDGVTIAESIDISNEFEALGGNMIKSVARNTVDIVGDGTTTSTVITQELVNEGFKLLSQGHSQYHLREGMADAMEVVKADIQKLKSDVGPEEIFRIATVAANNDTEIGNIVSRVFEKIGDSGTVDIRDGFDKNTEIVFIDGMTFDRGWALPQFINEPSSESTILDNVTILIYDGKVNNLIDINELGEAIGQNKSILLIAEDLDEKAMATIVRHKMEFQAKILVCMMPDFGQNRANILEDLQAFTGAEIYNPKYGSKTKVLGTAKRVIATRERTVVIGEEVYSDKVKERVDLIKAQIASGKDKDEKQKLEKRLANLQNSVAIINVGGTSEYDVKEKKDRIDDAVKAVKSSLSGGFVSGGGSTLFYISLFGMDDKPDTDSYNAGYNLVRKSIMAPFRQILANAEMDATQYINKIDEYGVGVNVRTRKVENLLKTGIIDSAKVVTVSFENAMSIAMTVLQTNVLISGNGL